MATLIDYVLHAGGGEEGCVLEVSNAIGDSIRVAVVPGSAVNPQRADEVMAVRLLA